MGLRHAFIALVVTHTARTKAAYVGEFRQRSSEPKVTAGSPSSSSLEVSWDTTGDKAAPRVIGYELQYARGDGDDATAVWQTVEGNNIDTWEISIQVDGFDRSTGRTHTVQDGWFTLEMSRSYPKPSPLPDLRLETEPIAWDDTWAAMEAKVYKALRESEHPQYASWTAAVVRCDETEERGGNHWAGGCPFLDYGGLAWHLRLSPPTNSEFATREDVPVVTIAKETITAKWSGQGDQVISTRYGFSPTAGELDLIDPFFCQGGSCLHQLEGLSGATPYLVRLRAYNQNGFGPWKRSTSDMSLGSAQGIMRGIFTDADPAMPIPKAPRLSSSTSSSLTVFIDTVGEDSVTAADLEAYELEIQRYKEVGERGDNTAEWTPVVQKPEALEQVGGPWGPSLLTTATELSPSTSYRFRVKASHVDGVSHVSDVSAIFTTGPGVPRPSPSAPAVDVESITSSRIAFRWTSWAEDGDEQITNGGKYDFEAQWERLGSGYWQQATKATLDSESQEWQAVAEGLEPYAQHRFRVRAVNSVGAGAWSAASDWVRTEAKLSYAADENVEAETVVSDIPESVLLSAGGDGRMPGHAKDFDYYHGVGVGGQIGVNGDGGSGGDGLAVIVARVPGVPLPTRTPFFFDGAPELYAVPSHSSVTSVTLKLWGAGGGGVLTPAAATSVYDGENGTSNATRVPGGGGGFLQAEVSVSPGELLEVLVGGGGGASRGEVGGAGGFNGGQAGGSGRSGAAGGGGSTSIFRREGNRLVAAAGGGGGAGNADICCADGGAGGGIRGLGGGSPAFEEAVTGTGGGGECKNGWCSASEAVAISYEGIENWVTTGGGGGSTMQGGLRGNSDVFDWVDGGGGRQGAISSPRSRGTSMPVVYEGTSSRTATPGQSLRGGMGADGPRGGGGGGGGFYGGGGGGSGAQGAGGGGGSSYAEISELAAEDTPSGGVAGESIVRIVEVGESWAEVEWDRSTDAVPGEEPIFYEIGGRLYLPDTPRLNMAFADLAVDKLEISEGYGSEDFYPSATVDALGGNGPSLESSDPRGPGGAQRSVLRAFLLGLSASTEYNVRVAAVSRLGRGKSSALLIFSTEVSPTNEWKQVIPRPSRVERRGRGLTSPDLGENESWDTDLAAVESAIPYDDPRVAFTVNWLTGVSLSEILDVSSILKTPQMEGGGFSDPPTEQRQEFPSPRSGHTFAVVAGKVYMFGGLSSNAQCSSAMVGSTALGDTPGGVITEDCVGADRFSAELWEFDPPLRQWTEVLVGAGGDGAPAARSGHTASVSGSKMIVFGGRGNASDSDVQDWRGSRTALLGDEWEIDLDPSRKVTVATNSSTAIREGAQTFIPLVVATAATNAQQTDATIIDTDMCVSDLTVSVHIDHGCTGQLRLTLYGPGPPPGDTSELLNTPRAEPAVLFVGRDRTNDAVFGTGATSGGSPGSGSVGGCVNGMDVSFADSAESSAEECCGEGSSFTGHFKAVDRLLVGQFLHMPAEGEWTLGVLDTAVDGSNGTVVGWSLDIEMRPCDWRSSLRWNNVTSSVERSSPAPRAHHVAAVVDGGLFVSGGAGMFGAMSDLWRRGDTSSEWKLLAEGPGAPLVSTGPFTRHGASMVVSPWGLLSIGGMTQGIGVGAASELWVLDPVSSMWRSVSGDGGSMPRPPGRYDGAAAIAKGPPVYSTKNVTSHDRDNTGLLLFGGKDDWRRLDDIWRLKLSSISVSTSGPTASIDIRGSRDTRASGVHVQAADSLVAGRPQSAGSWTLAESGRDERCAHVLVSGTANDTWHASCGDGADPGGEGGSCTMTAVLKRAWCLGENQGIGSPH